MTTVLIAGGGGREHALAWACSLSSLAPEIICCPGNGGTAALADNRPVAADDAEGIAALARERDADLVILGPDAAAAAGVADACARSGTPVFGPSAAAARVETSKTFAKRLMDGCGIPTAAWRSGGAGDLDRLAGFAAELGGRCVVKADGLALGKGVTVCDDLGQAHSALRSALLDRSLGEAGARVVVEERLEGREVSVLAVTDGARVRLLPPARDYKRAYDADLGPNTGGMGAVCPPERLDVDALLDEVLRRVVEPCVHALSARGTPFIGCLYAGLILAASGLHVLEFNCRFGDPEAQVVLPLLDEDALDLFLASAHARLTPGRARVRPETAVGVVAAASGYPGRVEVGQAITGLDDLEGDILCFHGGTWRDEEGVLRTSGGRVLTMVGCHPDAGAARSLAYRAVERVSFEGIRYRRDIAEAAARAPA